MKPHSDHRHWHRLLIGLILTCSLSVTSSVIAQLEGSDPLTTTGQDISSRPSLLFDWQDVYGTYYFGDGLGVNCSLTISADHRFTFSWHGCLGEYDRNAGTWETDGDVVVLKPKQPNVSEGFQGVNVRFVPVKVGQVEFLVDEFEMPGFCAALATDDAPFALHGKDFVKTDDEDIHVHGVKPVVPERSRHFYEKGAIEAKVLRIDVDGHAVLNKGSNDRLVQGMRLAFNGFDASIELVVLNTTETEAVTNPQYYWNSGQRTVQVGDEFTTGGYWHRPRGTGFERFDVAPECKDDCGEDADDDDG